MTTWSIKLPFLSVQSIAKTRRVHYGQLQSNAFLFKLTCLGCNRHSLLDALYWQVIRLQIICTKTLNSRSRILTWHVFQDSFRVQVGHEQTVDQRALSQTRVAFVVEQTGEYSSWINRPKHRTKSLPTTSKVNSKPFFRLFRWTCSGRVENPTCSFKVKWKQNGVRRLFDAKCEALKIWTARQSPNLQLYFDVFSC